jgi:site-specific recombinase XerD
LGYLGAKYLERHCESPRTLERYTGNWKWLAFWLQEKRYHSPRAITYRNALEYIDWRTSFKKKTGKTVGRNTAIMELKLLAMIMGEAVRLGHADANPLVSLKLRRDKAAKKPELTDKEISEIREALKESRNGCKPLLIFPCTLAAGCGKRGCR